MRAEIIKLRKRIDTTFIYVTHDQTEAMTLGDRIVIMKDGVIQQIGTPQQVFNHPHNLFVAGFIGTPRMNFFPARLEKDGDGYTVAVAGTKAPLPEAMRRLKGRSYENRDITVGIRPEHIDVVAEGTPGSVKVEVDVAEMMGSEIYMHMTVDASDVIIRVQTTDIPESSGIGRGAGAQVSFVLPGALVHLFDKESGVNLLASDF
jgi:multiple sugar transport system ATP-binding protein